MATQFNSAKMAITGTDHHYCLFYSHTVTVLAAPNFIGNKHTWDREEFGRHLKLSRCQMFYIACIFPGNSVCLDKQSLIKTETPILHLLAAPFGKIWPQFLNYFWGISSEGGSIPFYLQAGITIAWSPMDNPGLHSIINSRHRGRAELPASNLRQFSG